MTDLKSSTSSISFPSLLFLLFLGLKLGNVIDWSWWWVTVPLWGPLSLLVVIAGSGGIAIALRSKR